MVLTSKTRRRLFARKASVSRSQPKATASRGRGTSRASRTGDAPRSSRSGSKGRGASRGSRSGSKGSKARGASRGSRSGSKGRGASRGSRSGSKGSKGSKGRGASRGSRSGSKNRGASRGSRSGSKGRGAPQSSRSGSKGQGASRGSRSGSKGSKAGGASRPKRAIRSTKSKRGTMETLPGAAAEALQVAQVGMSYDPVHPCATECEHRDGGHYCRSADKRDRPCVPDSVLAGKKGISEDPTRPCDDRCDDSGVCHALVPGTRQRRAVRCLDGDSVLGMIKSYVDASISVAFKQVDKGAAGVERSLREVLGAESGPAVVARRQALARYRTSVDLRREAKGHLLQAARGLLHQGSGRFSEAQLADVAHATFRVVLSFRAAMNALLDHYAAFTREDKWARVKDTMGELRSQAGEARAIVPTEPELRPGRALKLLQGARDAGNKMLSLLTNNTARWAILILLGGMAAWGGGELLDAIKTRRSGEEVADAPWWVPQAGLEARPDLTRLLGMRAAREADGRQAVDVQAVQWARGFGLGDEIVEHMYLACLMVTDGGSWAAQATWHVWLMPWLLDRFDRIDIPWLRRWKRWGAVKKMSKYAIASAIVNALRLVGRFTCQFVMSMHSGRRSGPDGTPAPLRSDWDDSKLDASPSGILRDLRDLMRPSISAWTADEPDVVDESSWSWLKNELTVHAVGVHPGPPPLVSHIDLGGGDPESGPSVKGRVAYGFPTEAGRCDVELGEGAHRNLRGSYELAPRPDLGTESVEAPTAPQASSGTGMTAVPWVADRGVGVEVVDANVGTRSAWLKLGVFGEGDDHVEARDKVAAYLNKLEPDSPEWRETEASLKSAIPELARWREFRASAPEATKPAWDAYVAHARMAETWTTEHGLTFATGPRDDGSNPRDAVRIALDKTIEDYVDVMQTVVGSDDLVSAFRAMAGDDRRGPFFWATMHNMGPRSLVNVLDTSGFVPDTSMMEGAPAGLGHTASWSDYFRGMFGLASKAADVAQRELVSTYLTITNDSPSRRLRDMVERTESKPRCATIPQSILRAFTNLRGAATESIGKAFPVGATTSDFMESLLPDEATLDKTFEGCKA